MDEVVTLDDLLAHPVDHERNRARSLPPCLFGVWLPVTTPCGVVSRSASQTTWAVEAARRRAPDLAPLTDADVLWLLVMGWAP
jgi:hypothetical protein